MIGVRDGANGAELFDRRTGEPFIVRGVNYTIRVSSPVGVENRVFAVDVWDPDRFDRDLESLAERGYNTVRLWIDSCSVGPECLAPWAASVSTPSYLDNLAEGITIAKERGMLLLLTSNDIPDGGGYGDEANSGPDSEFAGYRNAHFLSAPGVAAATRYWQDILNGLRERQAPTDAVLAWKLINEMWVFEDQPPLSLTSGSVIAANGETYEMGTEEARRRLVADNFSFYIDRVGAAIRELDPTTLVTVGFFHPKFPNPARAGDTWYVDTASLLDRASVDFFDFHAYPGVELSVEQYAENFGMIGYVDKPVIMGEAGAFTFAYESVEVALPAIARWMADSCALGWDGWLYWEFYRPAIADDATWGFTDGENALMDGLAPVNHPDPCRRGRNRAAEPRARAAGHGFGGASRGSCLRGGRRRGGLDLGCGVARAPVDRGDARRDDDGAGGHAARLPGSGRPDAPPRPRPTGRRLVCPARRAGRRHRGRTTAFALPMVARGQTWWRFASRRIEPVMGRVAGDRGLRRVTVGRLEVVPVVSGRGLARRARKLEDAAADRPGVERLRVADALGRIQSKKLERSVGDQRVAAQARLFRHAVLQQPMRHDHGRPGHVGPRRQLLLDECPGVNDELELERADEDAGLAVVTPHPLLLFDPRVVSGICRPDRAEHVAAAIRHGIGLCHGEHCVALGLDGPEGRLHLIGDEVEQGHHEVVRRRDRRQRRSRCRDAPRIPDRGMTCSR